MNFHPLLSYEKLERGGRPEKHSIEGILGDIKALTDKLHLLSAEFFAGNTAVRNELVHVLDASLRLKQLTRREYTDINNRLDSA